MPGTLFVVATPIGNLEDLSFRALRTLKDVDLIAAEDTRRTAKLLAHYEIRKPMVSLREHNEVRETPRLIARLQQGQNLALVSDAGTPGIADPGARFVSACHAGAIRVLPIPGPSAVTAALSASGLPADQYVFAGFPPSSGKAREQWVEALRSETRTSAFFEAPHRIRRTLADVRKILAKRQIFVFREISKIHETLVSSQILDDIPEIGEFCIVVSGAAIEKTEAADDRAVFAMFLRLTAGQALGDDEALALTAMAQGIDEKQAAKIVKKAKILADQQNRSRS
jgi:16S rRNA (cytidine1402-2'-O)-methyltransferase